MCNAVGWISPVCVQQQRETTIKQQTQSLAQKRFKYFLSVCGRKGTHGRENNNKWSTAPAFFPLHHLFSFLLSLVVSHCQHVFPHYICTVPLLQKASLEGLHYRKKHLPLLVFSTVQITWNQTKTVMQELRGVCEKARICLDLLHWFKDREITHK